MAVIQRESKPPPKGHQRPFHGVGFRLLDGGFVGLAEVHVDAVASAGALTDEQATGGGKHRDAHAGDVAVWGQPRWPHTDNHCNELQWKTWKQLWTWLG